MGKKVVYSIHQGRIGLGLALVVLFLLNVPLWAQEALPTDDIVIKATNAVIFEMTANMELTEAQINTIRPIVTENVVKIRNLQKNLEDGNIDGPTMYSQRNQLITDENNELSRVLSPDQMKVWLNIEQEQPQSRHSSSK